LIGLYLTHPQVEIDPAIPVPDWGISSRGRERIEAMLGRPWLKGLKRVVASQERKAVETARLIAESLELSYEVFPDMGENDRSSTGFLEPFAFERAADAFFAEPSVSWNGWERAVDAQARIAAAVRHVLEDSDRENEILFVGHGAVGTLLKCRLARRPISRAEDQPAGGGNIYAFSLAGLDLLCDWTPIERFESARDGS
jgi:broad specificity phosphatase PhoE